MRGQFARIAFKTVMVKDSLGRARSGQFDQHRDGALEVCHEPDVLPAGPERLRQRRVIPEGALAAAVEAAPEPLAALPVIAEDGASIVQLVRGRDEQYRGLGPGEVCDVRLLARPPFTLPLSRSGAGIGAAIDDLGDAFAEAHRDR